MKRPLEIKIKIDKDTNHIIGPSGYCLSNRPVTFNMTPDEIRIKEIKRDWKKEIRIFLGLEKDDDKYQRRNEL